MAHALGGLHVEVLALGAHAAEVDRQPRARHVARRRHVVVHAHQHARGTRRCRGPLARTGASISSPRSGLKKNGSQPSAISRGLLHGLRADRAQVDRDVGPRRVDQQLQRLAQARALDRQLELLALVLERALARERLAHDLHVLARARERARERDAVPALGHLRARDAEAEPEAAVGERVERGGGHGGHRRACARGSGTGPSPGRSARSPRSCGRARWPRPGPRPRRPRRSRGPRGRPGWPARSAPRGRTRASRRGRGRSARCNPMARRRTAGSCGRGARAAILLVAGVRRGAPSLRQTGPLPTPPREWRPAVAPPRRTRCGAPGRSRSPCARESRALRLPRATHGAARPAWSRRC